MGMGALVPSMSMALYFFCCFSGGRSAGVRVELGSAALERGQAHREPDEAGQRAVRPPWGLRPRVHSAGQARDRSAARSPQQDGPHCRPAEPPDHRPGWSDGDGDGDDDDGDDGAAVKQALPLVLMCFFNHCFSRFSDHSRCRLHVPSRSGSDLYEFTSSRATLFS